MGLNSWRDFYSPGSTVNSDLALWITRIMTFASLWLSHSSCAAASNFLCVQSYSFLFSSFQISLWFPLFLPSPFFWPTPQQYVLVLETGKDRPFRSFCLALKSAAASGWTETSRGFKADFLREPGMVFRVCLIGFFVCLFLRDDKPYLADPPSSQDSTFHIVQKIWCDNLGELFSDAGTHVSRRSELGCCELFQKMKHPEM